MYTLIKYLFDKIFALSLLIILLPFLVVICFILTIHHSGNPLFVQTRVGLNEEFFKIIKFTGLFNANIKINKLYNKRVHVR